MACHIDCPRLDEGLGGAKRKRAEAEARSEAEMDLDPQPAAKGQALTSASNSSCPTYDGVIAEKACGRSYVERTFSRCKGDSERAANQKHLKGEASQPRFGPLPMSICSNSFRK